MKISVSKFIIKFLESANIKTVGIYQGSAIMQIIDELGKSKKIKYFVPYHEQSLSMSVDAVGRTGFLSAGLVTSGPGATNILTGVCSSYYDSIPSLYITGQVGQIHLKGNSKLRQKGFQETDIKSIFKSVSKYVNQLRNKNDIKYELQKCLHFSKSGRPGPCILDVPYNLQNQIVDTNKLKSFQNSIPKINISEKSKKNIIKLFYELKKSKKPLFIVGGGIKTSNQTEKFLRLIRKTKIPFVTTWMSQDIVESDYPYYLGSIGKNAHKSANIIATECDLIISLGQRFHVKNIFGGFGKKAKIFAVDIDKNELDNNIFEPKYKIHSSIDEFFNQVKNNLKFQNKGKNEWIKFYSKIKKDFFYPTIDTGNKYVHKFCNPYSFLKKISKYIKVESRLFPDVGNNEVWFFQGFPIKKGQKIINQCGHAPMGHSLSAAIGVYLNDVAWKNDSKKNYICFIGDGGLMMNIQDLGYIQKNNLPIKIIVFDNKSVASLAQTTKKKFNGRAFGTNNSYGFYSPDIRSLASGFKIKYTQIKNNNFNEKILKKFINLKGPAILNLNISPNQEIVDLTNFNF
jgi:acetolactate synthase I/II/III large subunit